MDRFEFRGGVLHRESIEVVELVERFGTPADVYRAGTLHDHFARSRDAFAPQRASICCSPKSCRNLHIPRLLCE